MPRHSHRQKAIHHLKLRVEKLRKEAFERDILDEDEDSVEEDYLHDQTRILKQMTNTRYLFRKSRYRTDRKKFDLEDCLSTSSVHYNDEEFLKSFRITRNSFLLLLEVMKETRAFKKVSKKKKARPISYQLLVFLFRIGKEGTGGSCGDIAIHFGIGKGTIKNYCRRSVNALLEMKKETIYWPDKDERLEMRNRLSANGFRHCVGIIDGTLIGLAFRPEAYHECYYTHKSTYALNVMIVCDDKKELFITTLVGRDLLMIIGFFVIQNSIITEGSTSVKMSTY